ncbi:PQQ-dependent sugar dehydrogenase [Sphingobacterium sp. DN00404]|uniref:Acyl carrier protein n=1 Tax=Sphingobacterium micropteri TaxID=2763501 RepID=A0ABR7YLU4_9SPHI|nr:PQQ-dependent sugar dehydrogenase [Sphingobacterium micropteri]MBD1432294.1 PQQ-dependent sugar dehydrogenase [Sphingobacterium micropteri]
MTKAIITFLCFYIVGLSLYGQTPHFERSILRSQLADPWSIAYGADGHLWITESKTYRVLRIDPETKDMKVVLDLSAAREFPRYDTLDVDDKPWPQGGLMGMVLHPKFTEGSPYVYLAYIYKHLSGNDFMSKLSRFRYDEHTNLLRDEEVIDQEIPGSNDHNGGRLEWAQQDGKYFLFYALGDMGAGQYSNVGRKNHAQDLNRKEGKILRNDFSSLPYAEFKSIPDNPPVGGGGNGGNDQNASLYEQVEELIFHSMGIPPDIVQLDSHFVDDLNFDSLDVVEFFMDVELEFDVLITDEEMERTLTVRSLVELLQRKIE